MKKIWGIAVIALVVVVLVAATIAMLAVRASEDAVTADMVEMADSLAIPPGSELLSEVIRREQTVCLDTNPCPSMHRNWQTSTELTTTDLQQIMAPLGVDSEVEGSCLRAANVIGDDGVCAGIAVVGDLKFLVSVTSPGVGESHRLSVSVRPVS